MAEEMIVNGDASDDIAITTPEQNSDESTNQTIQKLMQKVSILEQEKQSLVNESQTSSVKIKQLEQEIESSESDKRALSSIAARASELETEVFTLQHDLISSISDSQDSNNELVELKKVVESLKESESKKSERIDVVEKERELLLEKLSCSEKRVGELEREVGEKEEAVVRMCKTVEEIRVVMVESRGEVEKAEKVKVELERKAKELKERVCELEKELEAVEKVTVKERNVNGIGNGDEKKVMGMKVDWPVVAASAGAGAMVAVVYFRHAKF